MVRMLEFNVGCDYECLIPWPHEHHLSYDPDVEAAYEPPPPHVCDETCGPLCDVLKAYTSRIVDEVFATKPFLWRMINEA